MKDYLINLIFPKTCIFCGEPTKLHSSEPRICEECKKNIPFLNDDSTLWDNESSPVRGISVFEYLDIKDSLFHFKYDGCIEDGKILAGYMADYAADNDLTDILDADLIVPVPLWHEKEKKRGFNQSAIIAEVISEKTGIMCIEHLLERTRKTKPQNGLNKKQRAKNLENAFKVNEEYDISDKTIVLVDDIYTTGSTIYECAKTLYESGAAEVIYFALSSPVEE